MAIDDDTLAQHGLDDDGSKPRTNARRGWPKLPGHDATLAVIRDYLTQAASLPPGWVVDLAERHGRYGSDPLTITIRTPGQAENISVRFDAQRECSKPAALRGTFMEATNGASRMRHPKPGEAGDFYVMVCALASVSSTATVAEETEQWLYEYLGLAHVLKDLTLAPAKRYDTLLKLRKRPEFDRRQATRYLKGDLDEQDRWIALADSETGELWVRAGELAAYMRHVYGVGTLAQHTLDARITEVGGERERLDEDRRSTGGTHVALVLYRFPSAQAFPTVSHENTTTPRARLRATP